MPADMDLKPAPPAKLSDAPSPEGRFGSFGGRVVPEQLVSVLAELEKSYDQASGDRRFWEELKEQLRSFGGRPTPLHLARRFSDHARTRGQRSEAGQIWLKREDLAFTGSHAVNNAYGQAALAMRAGKRRLLCSTRTGRHGLAVASAAARLGMSCRVLMSAQDLAGRGEATQGIRRLGGEVVEVAAALDPAAEALRQWGEDAGTTHWVPQSCVGPHPYPMIVRDLCSLVGNEVKAQALRALTKLPDMLIAPVGGGGLAAGLFFPFIDEAKVQLVGVQGGGRSSSPGEHAAVLAAGVPGVALGCATIVLQDPNGGAASVHSAAAGLRVQAVGPELAFWKEQSRARFTAVSDAAAADAMELLARCEGILASAESGHALAEALSLAPRMTKDQAIVVAITGEA